MEASPHEQETETQDLETNIQETKKPDLRVASSTLLHVLKGVALAVGATDECSGQAADWFSAVNPCARVDIYPSTRGKAKDNIADNVTIDFDNISDSDSSSSSEDGSLSSIDTLADSIPQTPSRTARLDDWISAVEVAPEHALLEVAHNLTRLVIGITGCRASRVEKIPLSITQVKSIAKLIIDGALQGWFGNSSRCVDSLQGCTFMPVCTLQTESGNCERFELRYWRSKQEYPNQRLTVQSYSYATEYLGLFGNGISHSYRGGDTETAADPHITTHRFQLSKDLLDTGEVDARKLDAHWRHVSPTLVDSKRIDRETPTLRPFGTAYTMPPSVFHSIEADHESSYIALASYELSQSSEMHIWAEPPFYISDRCHFPSDTQIESDLDQFEFSYEFGKRVWASRKFLAQLMADMALSTADALQFPELDDFGSNGEWQMDSPWATQRYTFYKALAAGERGRRFGMYGRYREAKVCLEEALDNVEARSKRIELLGQLSSIYASMDNIEEASRIAVEQREMASQLNYDPGVCNAIGLLGTLQYRLCWSHPIDTLERRMCLQSAIDMLSDYVHRARRIELTHYGVLLDEVVSESNSAVIWQSYGLGRLSLCYTAQGDMAQAISTAEEALRKALDSQSSSVITYAHFFLGRALLHSGQVEEAKVHFDSPEATMLPILLVTQPTAESLGFLAELANFGLPIQVTDGHGCTTLDYAVFTGSKAAENLIAANLGVKAGPEGVAEAERLRREAVIRCDYRIMLQEKLRPALLQESADRRSRFKSARKAYADTLATDVGKASRLDCLKFVWYTDFKRFGRLPRSSDGLTHEYKAVPKMKREMPKFIILISYRWLHGDPKLQSPDDGDGKQYLRMIQAVELLIKGKARGLQTEDTESRAVNKNRFGIRRKEIGLWMDYACVDQDKPEKGVVALPLLLAQCDMVISLLSEDYYARAWCLLEAQMAHALSGFDGACEWVALRDGEDKGEKQPLVLQRQYVLPLVKIRGKGVVPISASQGSLSYEAQDRPLISFLESQVEQLKMTEGTSW